MSALNKRLLSLLFLFVLIIFFLSSRIQYSQAACNPEVPLPDSVITNKGYDVDIKVCNDGNYILHIRKPDGSLDKAYPCDSKNLICPVKGVTFSSEGTWKYQLLFAFSVIAEKNITVTTNTETYTPTCNYQSSSEIPTCDNDTNPTNGPCCPSTCTSAFDNGVWKCKGASSCIQAGQTCSNLTPCCSGLTCVTSRSDATTESRCQQESTPTPALAPTAKEYPILTPPCSTGQCNTAIGKITINDPAEFIQQIYKYVLAIAVAAAIVLLIYSGYVFMVSSGDKTRLQGARETIISAIAGLLFILFAVAILEFIGISILHIPGFNAN